MVCCQVLQENMESVDVTSVKEEPSDTTDYPHATLSDVKGAYKEEPSGCHDKSAPDTSLVKRYQCSSHTADVKLDLHVPALDADGTVNAVNPNCSEKPYPVLLIKVKTEATDGWPGVTDTVAQGQHVDIDESIHRPTHIELNSDNTYAEVKQENEVADFDRSATFQVKGNTRSSTDYGDRDYGCDLCEKTFAQKHSLVVHCRTHTGAKPYKCDVCEKTFTHHSHLVAHSRRHNGKTPYKCDKCKKTFVTSSNLVSHLKIHTGDKPYKCDVCGKTFAHQSNLTVHTRVHTGEKPYQCDICLKSFSSKFNREVHTRTHSGDKPST
jgi:hypothetical protein